MSLRLFALVLLLAPGLAHAQEQPAPGTTIDLEAVLRGEGSGLTADEAAARAVGTSPQVERAEAQVRTAQAGADRVVYQFIPRLTLSGRYTRLSEIDQASLFSGGGQGPDPERIAELLAGVDDPEAAQLHVETFGVFQGFASVEFPVLLNQFAFRAELLVPLSDLITQVWPTMEGANAAADATRIQVGAQEVEVAYSAREAFYNYARARGALAVATIALQQAEARHQQVEAFVRAGTAARVDELRIRAQVATTRVAVARATGGVEVTATILRTLMHVPLDSPIAVGEDVLGELPALPGSNDELISRALSQRQDARALRRLVDATGHQITAAEGRRYPHLAVAANLDYANPNQRIFPVTEEFRESWDVSAVISWSLHDLLDGEQQANEARGRREETLANLQALEDGIRLQVIEATTAFGAAREALGAARLGVEAAVESERVVQERFRAGASTVTDVLDAASEQARAQLELVNAAIDARIAWARLHRALGEGVPE